MLFELNIVELKKSLDTGELKSLYIFTGEEYTILNVYIDKVCSKFDTIKKSESVLSIYKTLTTKSLLSNSKCVYVVRDDKEFLTSESIWNDLEKKLKAKGITLIVKYESIDARSKFSKHFADSITVFDRLSDQILLKYIKNDLNITTENATILINACKSDYGRILLEIDKIQQLANRLNISDTDSFNKCMQSRIIYLEPEGQVFDLVNCILLRDYKNVYRLLAESRRRSDNELYVLSLLHNNVKALLQIQTFGNSDNKKLIQATGLTQFQINNCMKYLNRYSCEELVRFIKYIKYCDNSVKDGTFTASFAIDYLIVNVI